MRPRALMLLLVATAADYLLWHWSLAGGHDVLALASGMTLLPLVALSLGSLAWLGSGPVARLLRRALPGAQPRRRHEAQPTGREAHQAKSVPQASADENVELERLAA